MSSPALRADELPGSALLQPYRREGAYTDCYSVEVDRAVSLGDYVAAFYTTRLFGLERGVLRWAAGRPSTDDEARALADSRSVRFAIWTVESRTEHQILMRDMLGRTRSWLMVEPVGDGKPLATRLYFGSAVVPKKRTAQGASFGFLFHALSGFHRRYSQALLRAAVGALRAAA